MKTSSNSLSLGAVVAAIGGVVAIMMMASIFDVEKEGIFAEVCMYLLTIVLFFAIAGAFKSNGQWNKSTFVFMEFILYAAIASAMIIGFFSILYGGLLLAFGIFSLICAFLSSKSDVWFVGHVQ